MYKMIIFDIGGTLAEYKNMPLNWSDYYPFAFNNTACKLNLKITQDAILKSAEIMARFNPRINHRENEIPPEEIFKSAVSHWNYDGDINKIIGLFFCAFDLKCEIYDYTIPLISKLKNDCIVGLLTDLPCGMSDEIFRKDIVEIINVADFYFSSQDVGLRKPNPQGIRNASKKYGINIKDILFVGDEGKDRKTAERAGCQFEFIKDFLTEGKYDRS